MARIGTFSEYVVCSEENLVKIRTDMPWPQAALVGCSVATGIGAVMRHARVPAQATVLVIGCGGVGLNIVQGARLAGAKQIIAADILDAKLAYAQRFGATETINASSENLVKRVKAMTGGLGIDYAFDAIGGEVTVAQIVDALAPGGAAVMVGIPASTVRASHRPFAVVFQEKSLSGSFYGSVRPDHDFPWLCDLYMSATSTLMISSYARTGWKHKRGFCGATIRMRWLGDCLIRLMGRHRVLPRANSVSRKPQSCSARRAIGCARD
jgi:S-(hydroxymethyl)glutathione dehydrogenase/alcohol dehydrogenase